jgi:GT2 family glycosyltransferase
MPSANAIVILNYNGEQHLQTYLPSVVENSPNWDIIVADNASTDNSCAFIESQYPQIEVIQLDQNYGFAGGYNEALAQLKGKYELYFILNSDVRLTPNWDHPLLAFLQNNPNTAAVGPKVLCERAPQYFEHAGAAGGYLDTFYFPFCRGRIFETLEKDENQYDSTQEVSWVSGAALLIRAQDFHEAGGFDAAFFAHMEEIDLCLRLGPLLFIRMALDGLAAIQFLFKGKPQLTWQVFLAHMALYRHFGTFYKKRKASKHQPFKYHGLIIWDYFGKGIRHFSALNKRKFHS